MEEVTTAVTWEAPEHVHHEKGSDWFWILGIIATAGAVAAFFLGNYLLTILIIIAAFTMAIVAVKRPSVVPFAVTTRGLRIGEQLYPYNTLQSYCIDDEHPYGPQLFVQSKRLHMPLLVLPLPEEHLHDIELLISERLPEEELEEPLFQKLLEFFGF